MLKALLMASVIIGAFFFQPAAYSQESGSNPCPFGGTLLSGMCTWPAPLKTNTKYTITGPDSRVIGINGSGDTNMQAMIATQPTVANAISDGLDISDRTVPVSGYFCTVTYSNFRWEVTSYGGNGTSYTLVWFYDRLYTLVPGQSASYPSGSCPAGQNNSPNQKTQHVLTQISISGTFSDSEGYQCPPDGSVGAAFTQGPFVTESGQNLCFYPASTPDNDNECPPDTVGGCDEPPEEPECSIAGNGMEVCPADPDEKCTSWVQDGQTYYDCPTNCGFINDQFFCTSNPDIPDIPDMSNCFKVATGYACPSDSPTPDDTLDNPNKPLPDMTKGDFKETNKGIETRLNATNKLLGDLTGMQAASNQALADLNAKQLTANGFLRDIRQNTADTAKNTGDIKDALTGDGLDLDDNHRGLIGGALGITGDESIDDLTKEEITLDSFRSEFQWSGGGGSCPAPRQINILGASFQMDWQPYCQAFAVASHFILAAAYFFAAFIAFGGRK